MCSAFKKLELSAENMLRREAASDRVRQFDEEQQTKAARLQSKVKYYEKQAAPRSNAVSAESNRDDTRNRAGSNGIETGDGSPEQLAKKCS